MHAFIIIFCSLGKVKSATNMERNAVKSRLKKMRPLVLLALYTVPARPCCHHSSPALAHPSALRRGLAFQRGNCVAAVRIAAVR